MPCLKIHQQKVQYPQIALFLWILQHCICCVRFPTSVESYTFLIPKNSKRKSALLWWCHETFCWCVEEIRTLKLLSFCDLLWQHLWQEDHHLWKKNRFRKKFIHIDYFYSSEKRCRCMYSYVWWNNLNLPTVL